MQASIYGDEGGGTKGGMSFFFTGGGNSNFEEPRKTYPYYEQQIHGMNEEGQKALEMFLDKQKEEYETKTRGVPYMKLKEDEKKKLVQMWKEMFVYRTNMSKYARKNYIMR